MKERVIMRVYLDGSDAGGGGRGGGGWVGRSGPRFFFFFFFFFEVCQFRRVCFDWS